MERFSFSIALWAASIAFQQAPPLQFSPQSKPPAPTASPSAAKPQSIPSRGQTSSSSVWQHLYRLVWPLGHFDGDIRSAASIGTEKSASGGGVSRLYLVNTLTGSVSEWPSAAGASEPAVCPDAKVLFYRRDTRLFKETIQLTSKDVSAAPPPQRLAGVVLTRLYACTQDGKGGVALWAENGKGVIHVLRVLDGSAAWENLPADDTLKSLQPQKVAEDLQHFRSMRPDGFVVWIRDHQLLGQRSAGAEPSLLVESDLSFSGSPSWIGDSQFLFVTAETPD